MFHVVKKAVVGCVLFVVVCRCLSCVACCCVLLCVVCCLLPVIELMFAVCSLLFVVWFGVCCCRLFLRVVRCCVCVVLLRFARRLLLANRRCCLSSAGRSLLFVVGCVLCVACRLYTVGCLLRIDCCLLFVV